MKLLHLAMAVLGGSMATVAQADELFYLDGIHSNSSYSSYDYGQGMELVYRRVSNIDTPSSPMTYLYPNDPVTASYIPGLKPKGSNFPHAANGYIEQTWNLSNGNILFMTEIYPSRQSYLYKAKITYFPNLFWTNYLVGNNAPNYDNGQALLNMGERGGVQRADVRLLHHHSLVEATISGSKVLLYGEYNTSGTSSPVALMKSTDMGDTWSKVIEWNTVGHQTRHIRAVVQNPYNGWIYIMFGYQPADSGIVAWDGKSAPPPDNTPLAQMGNYPGWKSIAGSMSTRAADLVFTPEGKCVWIPDVNALSPGQKLYGQRANYDLTGLEITSEVPYVNGIPPVLGARSSGSGYIYWVSYHLQGAPEKKIHIWKSADSGLHWALAGKVDIDTDWTAVPQKFSASYDHGYIPQIEQPPGTDGRFLSFYTVDKMVITGRDLEFVKGGKKVGSTVDVANIFNPPAGTVPVAVDDSMTMTRLETIGAGVAASANDINFDRNVTTDYLVTKPAHGTAYFYKEITSLLAAYCTYIPDPGFVGTDSFTYAIKTIYGTSNYATITVKVNEPVPVVPVVTTANSDSVKTTKGKPITIDLTSNDTNSGTATVNVVSYPDVGDITYSDSSKRSVTYTPGPNFIGTETFTYNLKDAKGVSNTAVVTVTVQ